MRTMPPPDPQRPTSRSLWKMVTGAWEVVATVRDNDGDLAPAAEYLERPRGLIQAAVTYYGAYPEEIDTLIMRNAEEAEEAHAAWRAGKAALRPR